MNIFLNMQGKSKIHCDNSRRNFSDKIQRLGKYAFVYLFIVFSIISCTNRKSTKLEVINEDSIREAIRKAIDINPPYRLPIDSNLILFTFNKVTFQICEGTRLISNTDSIMSGYITFEKDKIRLGQDIRSQDFFVDGFEKLTNGDYHFVTHYDTMRNIEIAVIKSNDTGLVTVKFWNPPFTGTMVHFIDGGFTQNLKIYE